MRWLCDENVPRLLVEALRANGEDVVWIRDRAPGVSDGVVLALAVQERRLCLTFDKDFGELVAAANLPVESGILLLRTPLQPSTAWANRIAAEICSRADWPGHFSVLEPGRVRMRKLRPFDS
jgi:predicted nuclease of predicted toxin-antitoxin system